MRKIKDKFNFKSQQNLLMLSCCASIMVMCYCVNYFTWFNRDSHTDMNINEFISNRKLDSYSGAFQRNGTNDGKGFILVNRYFEQQTGAAMNLLTLSKWAKTVGAFPVEPFVKDSLFHNHLSTHNKTKLKEVLHFCDYFDIDLWNEMCLNVSAMPLISWDTFTSLNPGRFILVLNTGEETSRLAFVNDEIMNDATCKESFQDYESKLKYYITKIVSLNMEIVRRVCISFNDHNPIHIHDFTSIIYGDEKPNNVVVWFNTWRGMMANRRIKIIEREYTRKVETIKMLESSQRIIDDSKRYIKNILHSDIGKYVAISFRAIKRAKLFYLKEKKDPIEFLHPCILQLQKTISLVNNTSGVFLAQDLGRFGDVVDIKYLTDDMITLIKNDLFHHIYNGQLTTEKWEQQFVEVTGGITDSGYIAAVQSEILKNSKCLIMFGGDSNFQRRVLYRYKQGRTNSDTCIHEVCYIR